MTKTLTGRRILVTQAADFMGPTLCEVLAEHGADIVASRAPLSEPTAPASIVASAGPIDVLIANLALPAPSTPALEVLDTEWREVFAALVDPLPKLLQAVLPGMLERGRGKVIVIGSASALRGMRRASTYSAARGAQLSYVQAVGVEFAHQNIQVNAIAQNFVDNPTYFPAEVQANPRFQERLKREVPLGRLVSAREDAEFVAYLCSARRQIASSAKYFQFVGLGVALVGAAVRLVQTFTMLIKRETIIYWSDEDSAFNAN